MNERIWGIIGGVALLLALLSPLVLGNSKKVGKLFEDAEALYEHSDYEDAIEKYEAALKESNKLGVKTEHIDEDFTTLANLKIALCYYELAEKTQDINYYHDALAHITKIWSNAYVAKHQEELTYLWAEVLYKIEDFEQAKAKFAWLVEKSPNSRWVAKALYTIGDISYQQQNYEEARSTFQKLIDEFPNSEFKIEGERRIAEIEQLFDVTPKQLVENEMHFEEFDEPVPTPSKSDLELQAEVMYKEASHLREQGSINAALQRYDDIVTQYPESQYATKAYIDRGDLYSKMRDSKNALANYEKALDRLMESGEDDQKTEIYQKYHSVHLIPQHVSDRSKIEAITFGPNNPLAKANRLRAQKEYAAAAQEYEIFANTNPSAEDAVYALYWSGRCYHNAAFADVTLFPNSDKAFRRLIAHYGDNSDTIEAYYRLVLMYIDWAQTPGYSLKWQLVIDTIEEANTKYANSDDPSNQRLLGRLEPLRDSAIEQIDKRVSTRDDSPKPHTDTASENRQTRVSTEKEKEKHYGQGLTFLDQNQYAKAISQFQKAINLDPQFKEAHCNLAVVYIEQAAYEKAISSLEKAAHIDPDFIEAHFNLGIAYLRLGKFEDARNAANTALSINPNYEPAHQLLDSIAD